MNVTHQGLSDMRFLLRDLHCPQETSVLLAIVVKSNKRFFNFENRTRGGTVPARDGESGRRDAGSLPDWGGTGRTRNDRAKALASNRCVSWCLTAAERQVGWILLIVTV